MSFRKFFIIGFTLTLLFTMCNKQEAVVEKPVIKKRIETICVYDRLGLRDDAGKWLPSLSLGEKVLWTGESKIDSTRNNREYLKVIASDSTVGWASAWGLITNARLGAVKESTAIHRRPDPLTVTENKFESMEMVAIKESKDKWLEVVGERRSAKGWKNKSGWIAEASVITDPSEVAIAVLATKAMREKDDTIKQEKLQFLLKNTSNTNSVFIQKIKANLRELKQEE